MVSARGGPLRPLMMVNLPFLAPRLACRAHDCSRRPDTDRRLSWKTKIGGAPPPRHSKRVDVDDAMDGVTSSRDLTAPPEDRRFGLHIASDDASSGKVLDEPGTAMLVEEVVPQQECAQPDLSRVPGQFLRGEMSKERRYPSNMVEREPHCSECGSECVDPAHDMSNLTPLDELSPKGLGDAPDLEGPHALDSAGTQGSSQRSWGRSPNSLVRNS